MTLNQKRGFDVVNQINPRKPIIDVVSETNCVESSIKIFPTRKSPRVE